VGGWVVRKMGASLEGSWADVEVGVESLQLEELDIRSNWNIKTARELSIFQRQIQDCYVKFSLK
jgi:hypothetical protein